jgi:hypothetical protein
MILSRRRMKRLGAENAARTRRIITKIRKAVEKQNVISLIPRAFSLPSRSE